MGSHSISDHETRAVLDGLRHVVRELRVSARAAEQQHGISGAQLFVLHHLADGVPRSVSALAAATFTHQSSVSVVVARLAAAGLVRCVDGHDDARRTDVLLTAAGRKVLRRTPEPAQRRLIAAIEQLTPAARRQLARGLEKLVAALGRAQGEPELFFENEPAKPSRRARRRSK